MLTILVCTHHVLAFIHHQVDVMFEGDSLSVYGERVRGKVNMRGGVKNLLSVQRDKGCAEQFFYVLPRAVPVMGKHFVDSFHVYRFSIGMYSRSSPTFLYAGR